MTKKLNKAMPPRLKIEKIKRKRKNITSTSMAQRVNA